MNPTHRAQGNAFFDGSLEVNRSIFESVKRVREGNEAHRHAPFARHTMRIPIPDFHALQRLYPDLGNYHDPAAQRDAWDRFERSAFAERYRVGKLHRGVIKNGEIRK
jgi:hypothetical protein